MREFDSSELLQIILVMRNILFIREFFSFVWNEWLFQASINTRNYAILSCFYIKIVFLAVFKLPSRCLTISASNHQRDYLNVNQLNRTNYTFAKGNWRKINLHVKVEISNVFNSRFIFSYTCSYDPKHSPEETINNHAFYAKSRLLN